MPNVQTKIQKAAETMIERYGDDALIEVDQRTAELGSRGQTAAEELWREIRKAVELLLRNSPDQTKH